MQLCSRSTLALAAAALFAAAPAIAQNRSSVELYGILDAGIEVNDTGAPGEGRRVMMNTGNLSGQRLGFRGNEDLGGGMSAVFNLEMGLSVDTGIPLSLPDEPTSFFARRSIVGLKGAWGELDLGRDYTPGFWTVIQTDRFRYGLPGTASTPSQIVVTRASNGLFYVSPVMGGLTARLAYTLGAESATAPKDRGRFYGGSLEYKAGPLFASAAIQRRRDLTPGSTTSTTPLKEHGIGAEYTAGAFVVSAGHWSTNQVTATAGAVDKSKAFWLGAGMSVGVGQINAQVTRTTVEVIGRARGRALTMGVEYLHPLSKRTTLYAAAGTVKNNDNARLPLNTGSQRVGGVVFGADPKAVVAGIRHSF